MIGVSINDIQVNIFPFDDTTSIITRYILENSENERYDIERYGVISSPSFIRFDNEPITFKKRKNYKVTDIRDELSDISNLPELLKQIPIFSIKYPQINTFQIIYLYLIVRGLSNISETEFVEAYNEQNFYNILLPLRHRPFSSANKTYNALLTYKKNVNAIYKHLKKSLLEETKQYEFFGEFEPPPRDHFEPIKITESIFLHLPNGESLYDIFNALDVSEQLPMIILINGDLKYYKIYQDFVPPDEWILPDENDGKQQRGNEVYEISFFLSTISDIRELKNLRHNMEVQPQSSLSKIYHQGTWNSSNIISIRLNFKSPSFRGRSESFPVGEDFNDIQNSILSRGENAGKPILLFHLGNRVNFDVLDTTHTNIKGTFNMPNAVLNKAVFSDLIMNDPHVS